MVVGKVESDPHVGVALVIGEKPGKHAAFIVLLFPILLGQVPPQDKPEDELTVSFFTMQLPAELVNKPASAQAEVTLSFELIWENINIIVEFK